MRHNPSRRSRGRGRKGPNPLSRTYESNGPDVKVRGTASHVAEKYMMLARDALSSGDTVGAENYFQHAEHYNRIIAAAQVQSQLAQQEGRGRDADEELDGEYDRPINGRAMEGDREEREPQPRENGPDSPPAASRAGDGPPAASRAGDGEGPGAEAAETAERPRRRRRAREGDEAVAEPAGGERRPRAGQTQRSSNGADDGQEDGTTRDGQSALAAFPD